MLGAGDPEDLYAQALGGKPVANLRLPLGAFEKSRQATTTRLAAAASTAGVRLVNPATSLCPDGLCPFVADGRALYKDGYHLRASLMKEARFAVYDRLLLPGARARASIE